LQKFLFCYYYAFSPNEGDRYDVTVYCEATIDNHITGTFA